jgi:hypothetical protein
VTLQQRIARQRDIIAGFHETIDWMHKEQFTMAGKTTADLVTDEERNIATHEAIIARLEGTL